MGKKKILILVGILLCVCLVFGIGMVNRQNRTGETVQDKNATEQISSEEQEAAEMVKAIREDEQTIDEQGSIFKEGDYQVFSGFGYQITKFSLCDSYDSILSAPGYREEGVRSSAKRESSRYAYVEINVTNEGSGQKRFEPLKLTLVVAQDGSTAVEHDPKVSRDYRTVYIGGFEIDTEDDHNGTNPLMEPGETIPLQLYFEYDYVEDQTPLGVDPRTYSVDEILEHPEYYIRVTGSVTEKSPDILSQDRTHIYFLCEPEELGW